VPHGGRQTGLGSPVTLGFQDEEVRCPGLGRDADPRQHCVSGPTGLFGDVIQSRDSATFMSRSVFGHRCLALERVT